MKIKIPVITIDGPSGTGKGTISLLVAQKLGWHYLDSGALYRILALAAQQKGVEVDDVIPLVTIAKEMNVVFMPDASGLEKQVLLEGHDVSAAIRTEHMSRMSSIISAIPEVRDALMQCQRDFQQSPGLITDGRDMGTVVFPDAQLKIYMTASNEIKAQRRYHQLKSKGINVTLADILDDLNQRDRRDEQRAVAPLKPAADAVLLDTSDLTIAEVVEKVMGYVEARHLVGQKVLPQGKEV